MSERNIKIHINKKITPLVLISEKFSKYSISDLIIEVDQKTVVIMEEIKEQYTLSKKELLEIEKEISYLLSEMLVYQVEVHDNIFLDDFVSYIIEIINIDIKELIQKNEKSIQPNLLLSVKKSILEITKFHDILFFSENINMNELQELNEKHTKSMLSIHYQIIKHLKKNKNNDITYIYNITNLIDDIYSSTLQSLFSTLINDDVKIKKYYRDSDNYIEKIKQTFIEKYSFIIHLNNKYYKKITT